MNLLWASLIRRVSRRHNHPGWRPNIPWGWMVRRDIARFSFLLMPLWLAPIHYLWWHWSRLLYTPFMRLGVFKVNEGGFYHEGRWVWAQHWDEVSA